MAKTAARHLAETILPAASLGLTFGTNIFCDKLDHSLATSAPIAAVFNSGGLDPEVNANTTQYQPSVAILVCGSDGGYTAAETLIENIRGYLIRTMGSKTVSGTTYHGTYQQGDTAFMEYDSENRPIFSANFRLYRRF